MSLRHLSTDNTTVILLGIGFIILILFLLPFLSGCNRDFASLFGYPA